MLRVGLINDRDVVHVAKVPQYCESCVYPEYVTFVNVIFSLGNRSKQKDIDKKVVMSAVWIIYLYQNMENLQLWKQATRFIT